jgi:hypothetical protein
MQEQADIYDEQLKDILDNTRWYLDNLHYLGEYRVDWHTYSRKGKNKGTTIVFPIQYYGMGKTKKE